MPLQEQKSSSLENFRKKCAKCLLHGAERLVRDGSIAWNLCYSGRNADRTSNKCIKIFTRANSLCLKWQCTYTRSGKASQCNGCSIGMTKNGRLLKGTVCCVSSQDLGESEGVGSQAGREGGAR